MLERHLRPDEIELLLDGEEGFGAAPLKGHVRSCVSCLRELESANELMVALDDLPDFVPSANFADRVMNQVHVFEPWHAAATRTAVRLAPATRPARIAAGLAAALSAGVLSAGTTWALARADIALILTQFGLERLRDQANAAAYSVTSTVLGQPGLDVVGSGSPELAAAALGGFVAVVGMGVVGLRALATASRRRS